LKVGLFIGYTEPTDGGGYTFIVELLSALERIVGQCEHDFVLCHYGCEAVAHQFPDLTAVDLKRREQQVLGLREHVLERYLQLPERIYRRIFGLKPRVQWEERVYVEEGIQFILRLSPWWGEAPRYNIPYGTLVWDLAHRNWPCFPEVGANSVWRSRQEHFALLVGRASITYTGTKRGQRELESYFQASPERIKILPHPTPSFAVVAAARPATPDVLRRLDIKKDYLFYPAQFWAHKNHIVILEACKLVRDQTGWDLGIVFTGTDKGNRGYVRAYARRLGLENICKFLDFVSQSELIELYRGALCLTYATFFGPDNLPPLEAFALGCPVVASAVPGSEEQLGDAALLFAPQDEQELARHILTLRDPDVRAQLTAKGRERTREGWTWEDYAGGLIKSLNDFASIRRVWP
jgi:glycosyltransferase involved in cell wall biosynthesis